MMLFGCYGNCIALNNHTILVNSIIYGLQVNYSSQSAFSVNESSEFVIENSTFVSNEVTGDGAIGCSVLHIFNGHMMILNSVFDRNHADSEDSLPDKFSSTMCLFGGDVVIEGSNFTNHWAQTGGVMYAEDNCINISGSEFHSNSANGSGGSIYAVNSVLNIVDSSFELNSVNIEGHGKESQGGAILARTNSNVTLMDTTFFGNMAKSKGGVLFAQFSTVHGSGNLTFDNNTRDYWSCVHHQL